MSDKRFFRLFATDIDGTLTGDPDGLALFYERWTKLDADKRPILCYNTGRTLDDALDVIQESNLPEPKYIISDVGTRIYDYRAGEVLKAFSEVLGENWDPDKVGAVIDRLDLKIAREPDYRQHGYESRWRLEEPTNENVHRVEQALQEAGLDVNVALTEKNVIEVVPKWANKGNALDWLLRELEVAAEETLVAGDGGNDIGMFLLEDVAGIVVGNAEPELYQATKHLPIYHADDNRHYANAVLDGLIYFDILAPEAANGTRELAEKAVQEGALQESIQRSERERLAALDPEQLSFIEQGYQRAIGALRRNITPLGFSAASLEDNESLGTDVNYRSVWARDGCIALIGSLPLTERDAELHRCQEQTLETILAHVSFNGHVPANVRIDDQSPDYSGVGGIAAVDSGLWLVIAFYEFVRVTGQIDFLRKHQETLQRVMNFLSAQDSNNDALLEIPEAGDWTDLFGRSYNVLYDEVLWYRANIAFGRMLELLGQNEQAGDYLRWSQVIKREIVSNFWPTTEERQYQSFSFAEQQYAIGDARYLLAQITPFDYSWRCDIYGNVLAYLFDVIGADRAGRAFRFMWGVGVNEPYPVSNLYPVVMAGDKDWRQYYTVNLLNLPHHYHNGGIWPFIGATWVRFVHKVGLHDLALTDLYKLAELNSLGVVHEWEFNEWAHGKTGRPMGKAYQAWSASEYILACHELEIVE